MSLVSSCRQLFEPPLISLGGQRCGSLGGGGTKKGLLYPFLSSPSTVLGSHLFQQLFSESHQEGSSELGGQLSQRNRQSS